MLRILRICLSVLPAILVAGLGSGCSSSGQPLAESPGEIDAPLVPAALTPAYTTPETTNVLPVLSALPALHRAQEAVFSADVLGLAPLQMSASGASFVGHTLSLDPQAGQIAWAVFAQAGYPLDGSLLPAVLSHNASASCWLAASQFSRGRWDLLPMLPPDPAGEPGATASLPLPGGSGLFSPDGTLYLAFISFGESVQIDIAELSVEEPLPLPTPKLLSASHWAYPDRIELRWERVPKASGYYIYRDTPFAPYMTLGDVSSAFDIDVPDLFGHEYWVAARNSAGVSALSPGLHGYLRPPSIDIETEGWSGAAGDRRNSAGTTLPSPYGEAAVLDAFPTNGYVSLQNCIAIGPDGRVFVAASGKVLAYDNGSTPAWEYELPGMASLLSLGPGGRLFVAYADTSGSSLGYRLTALDQASGEALWYYTALAPVDAVLASDDGICLHLDSYEMLAWLESDGTERWLYGLPGGLGSPAIGPNGNVYVFGSGPQSGLPSLIAVSPQRQLLWEAPVQDHVFVGLPLVRRSGEILAQLESLPGAEVLVNASAICFSSQGGWLWDYESRDQDACGLSDGGPGHLRFMTADIDDFWGGPASHGSSAVQSPHLSCISDAGQFKWAVPLDSLDSNFFTDTDGRSYYLSGTQIRVIYGNGAAGPLLGVDGAELRGMDFVIPAGPYRLLTAIGPYTGSILDSLRVIGQLP